MINDGRDSDALNLIDPDRSAELCDVGLPDYSACTAVSADGSTHLVLARRDALGAGGGKYDSDCSDVLHERTGELPLEYLRRIVVSSRRRQRTDGQPQ